MRLFGKKKRQKGWKSAKQAAADAQAAARRADLRAAKRGDRAAAARVRARGDGRA